MGLFSYFYAAGDPPLKDGVAELPEPDTYLFERAVWHAPNASSSTTLGSPGHSAALPSPTPTVNFWQQQHPRTPPRPCSAPPTPAGPGGGPAAFCSPALCGAAPSSSRGAGLVGAAGASGSILFDRYGGAEARTCRRFEGCGVNGTTISAKLRAQGMRLMCYLNTDAKQQAAVAVAVAESAQTLKGVLDVIQKAMKLERRMLYACQLFLPDGELVQTFRALHAAASVDTPIIVGCGGPFDKFAIPQHMLHIHRAGNGRSAPKAIKHQLELKRLKAARLKADQVRAAGHGSTSRAARHARQLALESNREHAARLRHEQMEEMIQRAAQQGQLREAARLNTTRHRRTEQQAAQRVVDQEEEKRVAGLLARRGSDAAVGRMLSVQQQQSREILARKANARQVRTSELVGPRRAREELADRQRQKGNERRMSHVARSVQLHELEQHEMRHRIELHDRIASAEGHPSPDRTDRSPERSYSPPR